MKGRGTGTWRVAASAAKWKQVSSRSDEEQVGEDHAQLKDLEMSHNGQTTVMLGGLPRSLTPAQVLEVLDKHFEFCYDFFYMPMDFQSFTTKTHAFINFRRPGQALECAKRFAGFTDWGSNAKSKVPCRASWAAVQGYDANIEKQRKSSHIHENIPEDCKPWVFDANGERLSTINIFMPDGGQTKNTNSNAKSVREVMYEKDAHDDTWWDDEWYGGQDGKSNEKHSNDDRKLGIASWKKTVEKKNSYQKNPDGEGKWPVWKKPHEESQSWNGYTKKETTDQEREFVWKPSLPRRKELAQAVVEAEPLSQRGTVLKAHDLFESVIEAESNADGIPPTMLKPTLGLAVSAEPAVAPVSLPSGNPAGGGAGGARYACLNCGKSFAKWSACHHHMMHEILCKQAVLGSDKQTTENDCLQQKCKDKALATSTDSGAGMMRDEAILREIRRFQ